MGAITEIPGGKKNIVLVKLQDGEGTLRIRVKSRRSGDWQIPTTEGRSKEDHVDDTEFWVLVDFSVYPDEPDFYIMSGGWLRRKIYEDHQNYLMQHGGTRPVTPKSTHHRVTLDCIKVWKNKWEVLGLNR